MFWVSVLGTVIFDSVMSHDINWVALCTTRNATGLNWIQQREPVQSTEWGQVSSQQTVLMQNYSIQGLACPAECTFFCEWRSQFGFMEPLLFWNHVNLKGYLCADISALNKCLSDEWPYIWIIPVGTTWKGGGRDEKGFYGTATVDKKCRPGKRQLLPQDRELG